MYNHVIVSYIVHDIQTILLPGFLGLVLTQECSKFGGDFLLVAYMH